MQGPAGTHVCTPTESATQLEVSQALVRQLGFPVICRWLTDPCVQVMSSHAEGGHGAVTTESRVRRDKNFKQHDGS